MLDPLRAVQKAFEIPRTGPLYPSLDSGSVVGPSCAEHANIPRQRRQLLSLCRNAEFNAFEAMGVSQGCLPHVERRWYFGLRVIADLGL